MRPEEQLSHGVGIQRTLTQSKNGIPTFWFKEPRPSEIKFIPKRAATCIVAAAFFHTIPVRTLYFRAQRVGDIIVVQHVCRRFEALVDISRRGRTGSTATKPLARYSHGTALVGHASLYPTHRPTAVPFSVSKNVWYVLPLACIPCTSEKLQRPCFINIPFGD